VYFLSSVFEVKQLKVHFVTSHHFSPLVTILMRLSFHVKDIYTKFIVRRKKNSLQKAQQSWALMIDKG
jgi:hypothetical protein